MREIRIALLDQVEITRADGEGRPPTFNGHAAVFGKRTLIGSKRWGFIEQIDPGAFKDAIAESDVRMLHNHNPDHLLARSAAGTLKLREDKTGLVTEVPDWPDTQLGRDLAVLMQRGDLNQMSFAFDMVGGEEKIRELPDDDPEFPGMEERTITKVGHLYDVSTVTYPAYSETDAALRGFMVSEEDARAILHQDDSDEQLAQARLEALEARRSLEAKRLIEQGA